jgi:flagellin-like protein
VVLALNSEFVQAPSPARIDLRGYRRRNAARRRRRSQRGVSDIIATLLLVSVAVVLAAVLYLLLTGLTHGPNSTGIGGAFEANRPISSQCTGGTFATTGCLAGDYEYTLTVESSSINFGNVEFEVLNSTGRIVTLSAGVGGFSVVSTAGAVAAQGTATGVTANPVLAMDGPLANFGPSPTCSGGACTSSTPFTDRYLIVIDMGTINPSGHGYSFIGIGIAGYSGTTDPLALP